jgi:hypothetical protein
VAGTPECLHRAKGISAPNQWLASPTAALANARTFDKIPLWRSILCSRNVSRTICHDPDRRSVHRCVIFSRWAWGSSLEFTRDPACAMRKSEPQRRRDAEIPRQRRRPRVDCDFAFPARAQLAPSSLPNGVARSNVPDSASLRLCVSAVPLPSSAWHGVHRSISQPEPRRSSAFICGQTALPPLGMGSIAQIRKLGRPPLPEHRASTVWVHPRPSAACATCRQLGMGFFARFFIAPRCTAAPSDL